MLASSGVAKIDEHAIAQVLGDKSIEARNNIGDRFVEGGDEIVHVFRVEARRKRHRPDHIANHDRQLSPLGASGVDCHRRRCFIAVRCGIVGVLVVSHIAKGQRHNR